jgi:hypothetical protein
MVMLQPGWLAIPGPLLLDDVVPVQMRHEKVPKRPKNENENDIESA